MNIKKKSIYRVISHLLCAAAFFPITSIAKPVNLSPVHILVNATYDLLPGSLTHSDRPVTGGNKPLQGQWQDFSDPEQEPYSRRPGKSLPPVELHQYITKEGFNPFDPDDDDEKDALILFSNLLEEMKKALTELETLIRKEKIRLLLVFDLDNTFYYDDHKFTPKIEKLLSGKHRLRLLQQSWIIMFDDFISRNRHSIKLVYNTARGFVKYERRTNRDFWLNIHHLLTVQPLAGPARQLMHFLPAPYFHSPNEIKEQYRIGIPQPDILITFNGQRVHLKGTDPAQVQLNNEINATLQLWLEEDQPDIKAVAEGLRSAGLDASTQRLNYVKFRCINVLENLSEEYGEAANFATLGREGHFNFYSMSKTINKGGTLRLALHKTSMADWGQEQDSSLVGIAYGDGPLDLPKLRPDLEISVLVEKLNLSKRDQRMAEQGVPAPNIAARFWWGLSVIPDREAITSLRKDFAQKLTHLKVIFASDNAGVQGGLLDIIKATIRGIRRFYPGSYGG